MVQVGYITWFGLFVIYTASGLRPSVCKSRIDLYTPCDNITKSVLGRVPSSCMLVLRLWSVMVASQHIVDTRQMLYKYMIL